MNDSRFTLCAAFLLLLAVLFLPVAAALAQSGSAYDLSWWTVDGGGATFNTGGGYTLGGTVGQPDAAVWAGDGYALFGGFWGGMAVEFRVYLPLMLRSF